MKTPVKKIALLGPESSGKTTLCRQLAEHYHTVWVPEYARDHIVALKRDYTLDDILFSAKQQLENEDRQLKKANRFLFCDTELLIAKVWCEDAFQQSPPWLEETIRQHTYDLYLLSLPDIPFKADAVRENPHRRGFFFDWYRRELEQRGFTYEVLSGLGDQRFKNAINLISKYYPTD